MAMDPYPKRNVTVPGVHPDFSWSTAIGSVNVRLGRAGAKLEELRAAWANSDIQTAFTLADYNSLTGNTYGARVVYQRDPGFEQLSWLVSELTHHLRSALNAVVWDNATRGGREPLRPKQIQFPISPTHAHWKNEQQRLKREIEPWLMDRLEIVQPMNEDEPRSTPLFILGEINNQDKHKLPVLSAASQVEAGSAFSYERIDPALPETTDITTRWTDQPLQEGLEVWAVEAADGYRIHGSQPSMTAELFVDTPVGKRPAIEFLDLLIRDVGGRLQFVRTGVRPVPQLVR